MADNAESNAFERAQRAAAAAALERMPPTVTIGAHEFTLCTMPGTIAQGLMRFGQCHTSGFRIEISEACPAPSKVVETVLHEILHALWWNGSIRDEDKEERTIEILGTALTALCQQNLGLLDWIRQSLQGGPYEHQTVHLGGATR